MSVCASYIVRVENEKTKLKSNETEKQEHSKKEGVITCYGMTIRPSYSTDTQSFDMYRHTVAQYSTPFRLLHFKKINSSPYFLNNGEPSDKLKPQTVTVATSVLISNYFMINACLCPLKLSVFTYVRFYTLLYYLTG